MMNLRLNSEFVTGALVRFWYLSHYASSVGSDEPVQAHLLFVYFVALHPK